MSRLVDPGVRLWDRRGLPLELLLGDRLRDAFLIDLGGLDDKAQRAGHERAERPAGHRCNLTVREVWLIGFGKMRIDHAAAGDAIDPRRSIGAGNGDTVADLDVAELCPRLVALSFRRGLFS